MATPIGLEPTISCVTGRHVNHYTTGPQPRFDARCSKYEHRFLPPMVLSQALRFFRTSNLELRTSSWWAMTGSNRRHPACKAGALPAELITRELTIISIHKNMINVKDFLCIYSKNIDLFWIHNK